MHIQTDSHGSSPHVRHIPALDGIRAIAILLVFAVHTSPPLLPGGRLGVDLFFVLSGFLITTILLDEHRRRGSIHIGYFYMRRALRLFPAMLSVAIFVTLYVWLTSTPEQLALTLHNLQGIVFYYFNWQMVAAFPNYLNHQWMFSHLWSLSVEEQFYIVWPFVILCLLRLRFSTTLFFLVLIAGITIPAVARAILWSQKHSLVWYFRTELRFDELMWGALTAMIVHLGITPSEHHRAKFSYATVAALLGLLFVSSFEGLNNGLMYLGGFSLVGFLSAVLIYGSVCCLPPGLKPILEYPALRWIGKISYGLYLWHWTIIRLVADLKLSPLASMLLEFSATFAVATLSFHFMERPILGLKNRFIAQK